MPFATRGFDLFYKRLGPTGSHTTSPYSWSGSLGEFWYTGSYVTGNLAVSGGFLNYPADTSQSVYVTTRSTGSPTYKALPWGSHACDMLWNVMVPSWSYSDAETRQTLYYGGTADVTDRTWSILTNTSKSFYRYNAPGSDVQYAGVASYSITSSWHIIDPKLLTSTGTSASFYYVHGVSSLPYTYPTYVGAKADIISPESSSIYAYDMVYPTLGANSTSSWDGQYFDLGGGAGITRQAVSRSMVVVKASGSARDANAATNITKALKSRRLFFPTPYQNSGLSNGTDFWFKQLTGYEIRNVFTENGGIYNIQLTIKKSPSSFGYNPDTGSFLSVFIHDVHTTVQPTDQIRVPGLRGWYPPDNNIVKIGNAYQGTPALSFYDIQTGYQIEKFNFNVIQYGYPAQLCIEPSGSLDTNSYFGIIVDDIKICKVGVTTDPRFIQPTTINSIPPSYGRNSSEII